MNVKMYILRIRMENIFLVNEPAELNRLLYIHTSM
jgi:hypothetical protein